MQRFIGALKGLNYGFLRITVYVVFVWLLFTANRCMLLFRYLPEGVLPEYQKDLYRVFGWGARFDVQAILYTTLPLVLFALVFAHDPAGRRKELSLRCFYGYSVVMLPLLLFLLLCDQQYYSFFQSHFNTLVFGIVQDDTWAVARSVWNDHPVVLILLAFALLTISVRWVLLRIMAIPDVTGRLGMGWQVALFLGYVACLVVGMRGTLDDFPLEKDNATVSDHVFLNFLTPNAIFSLQEAVKERSKSQFSHDNKALLRTFGYKKVEDALYDYLPQLRSSSAEYRPDLLYTETPQNDLLEQQPPNVVFAMMESMSAYYLDFQDSVHFDLLGSLAPHFKNDLVFRNFMSDENGTIPSLEGLMSQIPIHPIAQTSHKLKTLPSSVALVYQRAGYETVFVTGGKLGWRNLDEFIPRQGFDRVASQETILNKVPGAHTCEWGVYDEYLFRYVEQLLAEKGGKPKFIFVLTTTNHTPFERPQHYKPKPLEISETMKKLTHGHPLALDNFTNYQYAAQCLGDFVGVIKAGESKERTIVAATGDHNSWMLFQYDQKMLHRKFGVPFYLYVPPKYLAGKTIDLARYGSHKDVFPTLFHLSVSKQRYFNMGYDLLGAKEQPFFGVNENNVALSGAGAILELQSKKMQALVWDGQDKKALRVVPAMSEAQVSLLGRAKARAFLLHYYFNDFLTKE